MEINLLGLEEGIHQVNLKIENIQGITQEKIIPDPIEIRLIRN